MKLSETKYCSIYATLRDSVDIQSKYEELGTVGAHHFRQWLQRSGIAQRLTLETFAGDVVVAS